MSYRLHTHCRVCLSEKLTKYISLGNLPLSNNLCESVIEMPETYPLEVMLCEECGLSQLSIVVDPELLFGHYVYRSSINAGYVSHCRQMAIDLQKEYGLNKNSFMIDIAGNDGALLNEFKKEIGLQILNIDPAKNLAAICHAKEIPTLTYFWSALTSKRVLNGFGKADLITATNVFAHVDDVYDFMRGIRTVLKMSGVLVMEFPYLIDFIEKNEFDTCYFEHLSYFMISPLVNLCNEIGMNVMKVEKQIIHGGTVRVHIGYGKQEKSVLEYVQKEREYQTIEPYQQFAINSKNTIRDFFLQINKLKVAGYKIAAFAASAKGNTLLNCAGITCGSISYIVDQTPEKIGKYSPGTHIPIVSMLELKDSPPDYVVILSWNFAEEIKKKCRDDGYIGKFIIPIPKFEIVD